MPSSPRLSLLALALVAACHLSAQSAADEVLAAADTTWSDNPAATVERIDRLLGERPRLDSATYVRAREYRGRANRLLGEYVEALDDWQIVYVYARARQDSSRQVAAADQLGSMNTFMGNYREGQRYLIEVADIYDRIGTPEDIAGAMNGLAILYNDIEDEPAAIEMYQKAMEAYRATTDTFGLASVHANLGMLYLNRGEYDKAEVNILEQGRLDSLLKTRYGLAFHYDFLATLRRKQGRLPEALRLAEQSLAVREELSSAYNRAESRITIALILQSMGRCPEAIGQARAVLDFRDQHQSLTQETSAYEIMTECYEALGDEGLALTYHKSYKQVSDSLYRRDHLSEIADKNALYRKAKQDEEIAELGRQNLIKENALQRRNQALAATGLGLGLLAFFAVSLWLLGRKIRRQKDGLEVLNDQKDMLLREIHHRVKNNLQIVSSLLSLQSSFIQDDAALDALKLGRQRVRSMAIIHQRLYMRDRVTTVVNTREYLDQLVGELMATLNVTGLDLRLVKEIEDIDLDIDQMVPLGLVANELITNSLKYAFTGRKSGELRVNFQWVGEAVELVVADDGKGYRPGENDSFGSLLIQTFTDQLEGTLTVAGEDGTTVRLRFPPEKA